MRQPGLGRIWLRGVVPEPPVVPLGGVPVAGVWRGLVPVGGVVPELPDSRRQPHRSGYPVVAWY